MKTLSERMKRYEELTDAEMLPRVPIIIRVDGKNFSRLTRKSLKPYDPSIMEIMEQTMNYMAGEIERVVVSYQQSDEISFILRNDQSLDTEPWHGNRIQKIASVAAALATKGFEKALQQSTDKPILVGDAIFDARVFPVPSIHEAMNYLIYRQTDCLRNAISLTAQTHLSRKIGKKTAFNKLLGMKSAEKIDILKRECQIDFNDDLPQSFFLGICGYRVPVVMKDTIRKKWTSCWNVGKFIERKDFYLSILQHGHDIIREENILSHE